MNNTVLTRCGLAGWGVVRIPWADIPARRKNPGPAPGLTPGPQLKLVDEQAVLAVAAILQACQRNGWAPASFADWGVLAAPRYLGRVRLAHAIHRFDKIGVRGMSPLVIPTMSLHAVAGTVALVLGCHGPNFGVSGAGTQVSEILLNALSLCEGENCPGTWAVMTAWDPEPIPDGAGAIHGSATGIGVALALTPHAAGEIRLIQPDADTRDDSPGGSLAELASFLSQSESQAVWRLPIAGTGTLEIAPGTAPMLSLTGAA